MSKQDGYFRLWFEGVNKMVYLEKGCIGIDALEKWSVIYNFKGGAAYLCSADMEYYSTFDDINGEKLFDGDIVEGVNINGSIQHCIVKFHMGCFVFQQTRGEKSWDYMHRWVKGAKKVGNIHENPELLET